MLNKPNPEKNKVLLPIDFAVQLKDGQVLEAKKLTSISTSWYFLLPKWWVEYWDKEVKAGEFWVAWCFNREMGTITLFPLSDNEIAQLREQLTKEQLRSESLDRPV